MALSYPVDAPVQPDPVTPSSVAFHLRLGLFGFVLPLLEQLDARIDRRLVKTFLCTLEALMKFRNRAHGLLLSELGGYLMPPDQAPAGTKRLSNLLHSSKWSASLICDYLWDQARFRYHELLEAGQTALMLWDESVIEKPESISSEGLCAVRSSKAQRLKRIKPGFYTPPLGPPVFVPGLQWMALLLLGQSGPPTVVAMKWWTTRGTLAQNKRELQIALLTRCMATFPQVLHVFDRGYAGGPWLELLLNSQATFVVRWPKHYKLVANDPLFTPQNAWRLICGKRSMGRRLVWDARRQQWRRDGVLFLPVWTTDLRHRLWLVVSRTGNGREPWYLLTNQPVQSVDDAWKIIKAYARRWQIEMAWRYQKSELAVESPRLWTWECREKLLLMVTLLYAFLISLLQPQFKTLREWILRHFCHRTGERNRQKAAPLYRLRSAISRLWSTSQTNDRAYSQNSG